METISTILRLVRPGMYMAKFDVKNAYHSILICEDHQSILKFQYQTPLFKFTALPNGYTEGPKLTKLLKFTNLQFNLQFEIYKTSETPFGILKKNPEKILVAGYFDDFITMNIKHSYCCNNISEIILLLSKLGLVIIPEKSTFNPRQETEYLGFMINFIKMSVLFTPVKKQKTLSLCVKLLATEQAPIRQTAHFLGTFSSGFILAALFLILYSRKQPRISFG